MRPACWVSYWIPFFLHKSYVYVTCFYGLSAHVLFCCTPLLWTCLAGWYSVLGGALRASHLDLGLAKGNVLVYNAPTCLTQPSDTFTTRPVNLKHQISCSLIDVKYNFSHPLSPIFLANSPSNFPLSFCVLWLVCLILLFILWLSKSLFSQPHPTSCPYSLRFVERRQMSNKFSVYSPFLQYM